jgi:hypothetical protein
MTQWNEIDYCHCCLSPGETRRRHTWTISDIAGGSWRASCIHPIHPSSKLAKLCCQKPTGLFPRRFPPLHLESYTCNRLRAACLTCSPAQPVAPPSARLCSLFRLKRRPTLRGRNGAKGLEWKPSKWNDDQSLGQDPRRRKGLHDGGGGRASQAPPPGC